MKKIILSVFVSLISTGAFTQQVITPIVQTAIELRHLDGRTISAGLLIKKLSKIVDSGAITGLQVAIINGDRLVWQHSFGLKDKEHNLKLDDNTEMYAASLTKVVSAYLFLKLVEKGTFNLDRPIRFYLKKPIAAYPKWKDLAEDTVSFNKITPRMLLSHSAGMPVIRAVYNGKVSLISAPGKNFYYSNEGMNLLGFIIEEYTGRSFQDLAQEEVFFPLQMKHTSMVWDTIFEKDYSNAYYKDGRNYGSERRTEARAAGSMTTTASDYAKFIIALQTGKGLSGEIFDSMFSPQIEVRSRRGFGPYRDSMGSQNTNIKLSWGLGVGLFTAQAGPAFFHTGHGEANQNYFVCYPSKKIALVLMSNSENFERSAAKISKVCIGDVWSPFDWLGYND